MTKLMPQNAHGLAQRRARATGSLMRLARRENQPRTELTSARSTSTMLPVSISPQVEALTNRDSLSPKCSSHAPAAILSAISRSAVCAVRYAQQRLRQAHQNDASGDARWYSRKKGIQAGARRPRGAHGLNERQAARLHGSGVRGR